MANKVKIKTIGIDLFQNFKAVDLISVLGWPGFLVLVMIYIMHCWTTPIQKQEFVDLYILMKWSGDFRYFIYLVAFNIVVFFAQSRYYNKKYKERNEILENEIQRLSEQKSEMHKRLTGTELNHSKKTIKKRC
jgi:hypothetical protein